MTYQSHYFTTPRGEAYQMNEGKLAMKRKLSGKRGVSANSVCADGAHSADSGEGKSDGRRQAHMAAELQKDTEEWLFTKKDPVVGTDNALNMTVAA